MSDAPAPPGSRQVGTDPASPGERDLLLRLAIEATGIGIFDYDPTRDVLHWDARTRAIFGFGADAAVSYAETFLGSLHPEDRHRVARAVEAALDPSGSGAFDAECRTSRPGAGSRWIAARGRLVVDEGRAVRLVGTVRDVTAERTAQGRREALIELGDRLRDARTVGDVAATTAEIFGRTLGVAGAGYAALGAGDRPTVERTWADGASDRARRDPLPVAGPAMARLRRGETLAVADMSAAPWPPADDGTGGELRAWAQLQVPLIQRGELVGVLHAHDHAPRTWTPAEVDFAREVAERAWDGLTRVQADELQRLLNRELSHRLKNTLAIVQSIASQTLRNVTSVEAARDALVARLIALGKAHDILLTGEREAAGIDAVIRGALAVHDDRQPGRFSLAGPPVLVGPRGALSLALMLHELATNAVKYGALSVPEGRVRVAWEIGGRAAEPVVRLCWTERGGPPVAAPIRKGFGSRLIERGLAGAIGGEVALVYEPAGVVCRVTAPLAGFAANA